MKSNAFLLKEGVHLFQIFIVENEDNFKDTLSKIVEQIKLKHDMKAEIVFAGKDTKEFLKKLKETKENSTNLFFMDIDLDEQIDGISLSCEIRNFDYDGNIVFVTGHEEYARKTLQLNIKPLDYVVKGNIDSVKKSVEKAMTIAYDEYLDGKFLKEKPAFFPIKNGYSVVRIPLADIYFIETLNRKIYLYTDKERYELTGTISEMENKLKKDCDYFFSCHRAYIINLNKVKEVGKGIIYLINNADVPLSRLKTRDLKRKLTGR
jgi:two-component system response regulator AgrA